MKYVTENIWPTPSQEAMTDAIRFWESEGILKAQTRRERAKQLLCIVRTSEGEIAAIATAKPYLVEQLGFVCFKFRILVGKAHRQKDIAKKLAVHSFRLLQDRFKKKLDDDMPGLYLEFENPILAKTYDLALTNVPDAGHVIYIGRAPGGLQKRIWYFQGARIPSRQRPNGDAPNPARAADQLGPDLERQSPLDYRLENIWHSATEQTKTDVINFWTSRSNLPFAIRQRRANELAMVARASDGRVAAVTTLSLRRAVKPLGCDLYFFRTLVAPEYRNQRLMLDISESTYDMMQERFQRGLDANVIGFYIEVESRIISQVYNYAIISTKNGNGPTFFGWTPKGLARRVWYFQGAKIPPTAPTA